MGVKNLNKTVRDSSHPLFTNKVSHKQIKGVIVLSLAHLPVNVASLAGALVGRLLEHGELMAERGV